MAQAVIRRLAQQALVLAHMDAHYRARSLLSLSRFRSVTRRWQQQCKMTATCANWLLWMFKREMATDLLWPWRNGKRGAAGNGVQFEERRCQR